MTGPRPHWAQRIAVRLEQLGWDGFLIRYGAIGAGLPIGWLLSLAIIWRGDAWPAVPPTQQALIFFAITVVVAPFVGIVLLAITAMLAERRAGIVWADPSPPTWSATPPIDIAPTPRDRDLERLRVEIERLAVEDLTRFRRRLLIVGLTGYGYLMLMIATLIGVIVWLWRLEGWFEFIGRQLGIFGAVFVVLLLTVLRVRWLPPEGVRVTRASAPELVRQLEAICLRLDAPVPHEILVNAEANAQASEVPRFGLAGLARRYVVIGLPLLEAMPSDECEAIIAHEIAHHSRLHLRRSRWIIRLNLAWSQVIAILEAGHWARPLLLPFARWYVSRLEIYAAVVYRRHERESDEIAASVASAEVTARALVRVELLDDDLTKRVLPILWRDTVDRSEPPPRFMETLGDMLRKHREVPDFRRRIIAQLDEQTAQTDTHPAAARRLEAFGVRLDSKVERAAFARRMEETAGASRGIVDQKGMASLRRRVERHGLARLEEMWRRLHIDALTWSDKSENVDEATREWARARWAAYCDPDGARPLLEAVLERDPDHLEAQVLLAQNLIDAEEEVLRERGHELLERALRRDAVTALTAADRLERIYLRLGRSEDALRVQTRARFVRSQLIRSMHERHALGESDRVTAYALPPATVALIRRAFANYPAVRRAFAVRKETRMLRDQPCVVVALQLEVVWYRMDEVVGAEIAEALSRRLRVPALADITIIPLGANDSDLAERLRHVPGALIYEAEGQRLAE